MQETSIYATLAKKGLNISNPPSRQGIQMKKQQYVFMIALASLAILPQCSLFESKETKESATDMKMENKSTSMPMSAPKGGNEEVLITMYDGKTPKATVKDFEDYINEFLEAQPQYKAVFEMMPGAEEQIFDGLKNELVLAEWVEKNGIDKKPEYLKDEEKIRKFARRSLNVKYFQEAYPVKVTDAEVRQYYNDNKNSIPQLMLSQGGVTAQGVMFDSKDSAQAFYDKVKDNSVNFETAAKEANALVKDYGEINNQSFNVDSAIRKKLLELKKFPAVELIEINDKSYAVVKATGKKEPQYVPFEDVKAGIDNMLKQQKVAEALNKELDKLGQEYKVVVNKDYFDRKKKSAMPESEAAPQEAPSKQSVPMRAM